MVDQVKVAAIEQEPTEQSLRRNLTNRHIQLIAIGGGDRHWVIYGFWQNYQPCRAIYYFCLYDYRFYAVFRYASHGRITAVEPRI